MEFTLPEPRMVAEAREQIRWRRNIPRPLDLIVETLIFILVFLVSGLLLEGTLASIGMVPLILTDEDFIGAIWGAAAGGTGSVDLTGLLADSMDLATQLMQTPAMVVVMLFSTLGLIAGVIIYCRAIEGRSFATLGFRNSRTALR